LLTKPKPTSAKADTIHTKHPPAKLTLTSPRPPKPLTGAVAQPGE